jgi:hypothetical protein
MVRPGAAEDKGGSVEMSSTPSNSLSRDVGTGEVPTTLFAPEIVEVTEESAKAPEKPERKSAKADAPRASLAPASRKQVSAESAQSGPPEDLDDDFEPRPPWHWAVLALAVAIAVSAVYFLLLK